MPKNIILLSDGTGNSASKLFKTNVWRLYQALDLSKPDPQNPDKPTQIAYYDDGVGTASFLPLALIGGAFGWGLKRNVLDLYTFLCRHYQTGDRIYGFGFSRGAFTIRMLTGFIANQGLVHAETEGELRHLAAEAFRAYREERYRGVIPGLFRPLRNVLLSLLYFITGRKRRRKEKGTIPPIKFLGIWDTVAAYGLPFDELTHAWNLIFPLSFPDSNLSDNVECACHAMAIDDERLSLHPDIWNEKAGDYHKVPLGDRLSQVWFAGMHSNVGGGYPDDALSGVPLNWIMDRGEQAGLVFLPDERQRLRETACVNGKQYDSRQGLAGIYRYLPRNIADLMQTDLEKDHFPKIHESVLKRIANRVDGYAPIGLPQQYDVVAADGSILPQRETPTQAEDRMNRQKKVWNLVWWKRLVYFITVALFLLLATFPFYRKATPYYDGPLVVVSKAIGAFGVFLPGFLSYWLKSYQSHPGLFLVIAGTLAVILYVASRLQDRIFDQMRSIFDNPITAGSAIAKPPRDVVYRLHTNPLLGKLSKGFKEKLIPWVILLILLMFILRGIFSIIDSSGFFCTPTAGALQSRLENGAFPSNDICWASGVKVEEGKRYKVTLTINPDLWKDSTIKPTLGGFDKWYLTLSIPLRRHLTEPWFKPFARVGEYGNDDYPLNPSEGSDDHTLISEITARKPGELFLFVNDAVLPVPKAWQVFYKNNCGTAIVKVEPLDQP
jgi:Uncharacterized conserved protein